MLKTNKLFFLGGKRLLALLILVLFVVSLAACKKDDPVDDNDDDDDNDDIPIVDDTITTTQLELFDGPNMLESSSLVDVSVEGEDVFVYETRVNHGRFFTFAYSDAKAPVAIFDFEGSVEVSVTFPDDMTVNSAVVTPRAFDVESTIEGNTVSFTLDYPTSYTVEINDDPTTAVHLFTNMIETDKPDPNNIPDDMIYIGPGVHKADAIPVESGQTVYIAGGAVVYGQIRAEDVDDVTVRGRGIISGEIYDRRRASEYTIPIEFRHSSNITIEGVTFLDSAGWTINAYFLDGLTIDGINIITARANGDGISVQSSKNVVVKNSFVRTWDDSLVVKNYDRGTTENILFENMVLWTDLAQSMEVGYETNGEFMRDITFRDITVLHNFHKPVISIHNADDALIENVAFEFITVEDAQIIGDNLGAIYDNFFIDFQIMYNLEWSSSGGDRGSIDDVTVRNVKVLDGSDDVVGRIAGYDQDHRITNIDIQNVTYKDIQVESADDLNISVNAFASNVDVSHDGSDVEGARVYYPYELALEDEEVLIVINENIDQEGFLIPDFAIGEVPSLYMGNEVTGDFTAQASRGTSLLEWNVDNSAFEQAEHQASYAIDDDLATKWVAGAFETDLMTEFAALSIDFGADQTLGTIRVYGDINSNIYQLQRIAVFGIRASSTSNTYVKLTNSEDYEFSPSSGNYVDININPGDYKAIQLRFYNETGVAYPEQPYTSQVEFYPASLSYNKSVYGTPHEDVYEIHNLTDGNRMTYYESQKDTWPAEITINLAGRYDVSYISMNLPPLMQWETREMEIEVQASVDGTTFTTIVAKAYYTFDPKEGNVVEIQLDEAVDAQYVKFIITDNTAPGNYGAQLSQINIFE